MIARTELVTEPDVLPAEQRLVHDDARVGIDTTSGGHSGCQDPMRATGGVCELVADLTRLVEDRLASTSPVRHRPLFDDVAGQVQEAGGRASQSDVDAD